VALGAHFSAVWILVAGSWMHTPAGFKIVESPTGPRAVLTDFWAMIFNPSSMDRLLHTLIGCWFTGAFFVLSVAAYYLLKNKHVEIARSMMKIGLWVAAVCCVAQLVSGDRSARIVAKYQPAKLAAFEGVYETKGPTQISVVGWVDKAAEKVHSLAIPGGLSFLVHRDFTTPVVGLDQIPRDEWPNVPVVFQMFHLMVMVWLVMTLIVILGIGSWYKNTLLQKRWLLKIMVFSVVLPHIGQQAGWMATEMGRQPWIVWKVLRTSEGVSRSVSAGQVFGSITMFVMVYVLLFALFLFLLDRKIKHGPEPIEGDLIYRNLLDINPPHK
jgi:cytochrome d ubiquinol oxidase subunit I